VSPPQEYIEELSDVPVAIEQLPRSSSPPEAAAMTRATTSEAKAQTVLNSLGNIPVDVFFATDRLPTAELMPSPWQSFTPAAIVCLLCCAMFIGFSAARRFQILWLMGCGLAACLGVIVLHSSIVRWQQYTRLASNAATRFSSMRYEAAAADYPLHVGTAKVTLPANHRAGQFETPDLFRFEFVETPDKHIVLHSLEISEDANKWFDEISAFADAAETEDGFLFIHGYNVRFVDALKRTAQLAKDLNVSGPAICYSWPSRGSVPAYAMDEATVSWSAPHFEKLLLDLHKRTQCTKINVIAHSMGNRALLEAIERIDLSSRPQWNASAPSEPPQLDVQPAKLIHNLVMAAPDVDIDQFASRYAAPLRNLATRSTLYFSDSDRALLLSAGIHGARRLGFIGSALPKMDGIDPVHIGPQELWALGHSYYGDDAAVVADLRELFSHDIAPDQRGWLQPVIAPSGVAYWQIDRALIAEIPANNHR
jgi:esterase/lipase superfamily enzyme